jgi:hypothetical protein
MKRTQPAGEVGTGLVGALNGPFQLENTPHREIRQNEEPTMPVAISANAISLMSSIGFQIDPKSGTEQWTELVIDTFDQWTNPKYSVVAPSGSCANCRHDMSDDLGVF